MGRYCCAQTRSSVNPLRGLRSTNHDNNTTVQERSTQRKASWKSRALAMNTWTVTRYTRQRKISRDPRALQFNTLLHRSTVPRRASGPSSRNNRIPHTHIAHEQCPSLILGALHHSIPIHPSFHQPSPIKQSSR
jgi:hypothetical protein